MNDFILEKAKKFFLGANTPSGFVSYFNQALEYEESWNKFLIKGGPGTGKSSLMKNVINEFKRLCDDIEFIYCSSDYKSLDGVFLNNEKISIVDATPPHTLEPNFPGVFEKTISICDCWNDFILENNKKDILDLFYENSFYQKQAINLLSSAFGLIKNNYDIIEKYTDKDSLVNFKDEFLKNECYFLNQSYNKMGKEKRRFLSSVSAGKVVFFEETVKNIVDKIYVINDKHGFVSGYLLNNIRKNLIDSNFDIITCYCSMFSGKKIDHILIPSLKIAFVTSNEYHCYKENVFYKIYSEDFLNHIDENLKNQIEFNEQESKKIIEKVSVFIKEAKNIHDKIEKHYAKAVNFIKVDEKTKNVIEDIKYYINK